MKKLLVAIAVVSMLAFTGCKTKNPALTKSAVKGAVQLGVAFGVEKAPEAITYLRYAAPVVCEASKGTNYLPDYVITQLQANQQAEAAKNPQAVLIFNSAFGIYAAIYAEYGAEGVEEQGDLKIYLEALCEGILAGLPPTVGGLNRSLPKRLPLHLK